MADSPIKVGGAYVENKDHVPNPTDMVAQYNTSGTGAHGKIEEVAPVFTVDKVKTGQEVLAALDPKNTAVGRDKVLFPNPLDDNEAAEKDLTEKAKARVKDGVVIGDATPAEDEAAKDGDEGTLAAVDQERKNAASNSTGTSNAGQHEGTGKTGDDESKTVGSGQAAKKAVAKKTAENKSS